MDAKDYTASGLANFLHALPHVDLAFQTVNSTFNLDSEDYQQSLVFWAGIPVVWMLVTLLIIIMYFCYRCCQREVEQSTPCIKWTIGILALLSCSAVGAGFYGNEEANKGLQHFIEAANDVQETIWRTESQTLLLQQNINTTVIAGYKEVRHIIRSPNFDSTKRDAVVSKDNVSISSANATQDALRALDDATEAVNKLLSNIEGINRTTNRVTFARIQYFANEYGFYRWLIMVVLLSWLMVLFVLLMFALSKATKCGLLVIGALSILSLILCWMAAGFHLGVSVAIGDFCAKPHVYFEEMKINSASSTISYYIVCNTTHIPNPFTRAFQSTYNNIEAANTSFVSAVDSSCSVADSSHELKLRKLQSNVSKGVDDVLQTLMHLNALVECTNLHKDYVDGIEGICHRGLPGLMFLIVSVLLTGLFFTGLVLLVSGSWKSFVSRRDKLAPKTYIDTTEEDGPFLLQRDSSTPSYYSFLPGCRGALNEQMQMQKHISSGSAADSLIAPPVYNSNELNHQNSSGNMSNMARLNDASL